MPLPVAHPLFSPAVQPVGSPTAQAWCFAFVRGQLLLPPPDESGLGGEGGAALRPLRWLHEVLAPAASVLDDPAALQRHYLGTYDGHDCWALSLPQPLPGWRPLPLRAAMQQLPDPLDALAGRAAQVLEWDRSHRFCGVCGTATEPHAQDRARRCPGCGHVVYPRLSPAMMALVWRPGELLLARSPHYSAGMYSALAGFVEAGESLEDCLHREVAEEVGLQVERPQYYGSQSWPFPHSLMVAYTARYVGGEITPQPGEIEDARWFPIDALPAIPPTISIAGHLIRDVVQAMREGRLPAG